MFEFTNYFNDVKNYVPELNQIITNVNNSQFNTSILLKTVNDIDNMNDNELEYFIYYHFNIILSNIYGNNKDVYINLFKNERFLDKFLVVLNRINISQNAFNTINNICYDYMTYTDRDQTIVNKMIAISSFINRNFIPRLLGLGLGSDLANIICIARYSGTKLDVIVKRINFIIITTPIFNNSELIESVLDVVYNTSVEPWLWTKIFGYFMIDVIPEESNDANETWVTSEINENNSYLNLAVLNILNREPTEIIRAALIEYAESFKILNYKKNRFSLRNISNDYDRIKHVIYNLGCNENIYVP